MYNQNSPPNASPARANIIRIALLSGVVIFGAVIYVLRSSGSYGSNNSNNGEMLPLLYAFIPLAAIAIIGTIVLRGRQLRSGEFGRRFTLAIIGWALCEGATLFGGVYFLLTGNPYLYLTGLALFLCSLVLLAPSRGA
jgi:hypothetical protein